MSLKDKEKWNKKYAAASHSADREPCGWLAENAGSLPGKGRALDIAMGEGRNAIFTASLGYEVTGVDISDVGVKNSLLWAGQKNVNLKAVTADLDEYEFGKDQYDLILCFYFLDRRLFPKIKEALRPGGHLLYETFSAEHLKHSGFKKEWLLGPNELLQEFANFHIYNYRETDEDGKAFASLAARKPGAKPLAPAQATG